LCLIVIYLFAVSHIIGLFAGKLRNQS